MAEYRIDDLARESGTTTRNIRGYQERGLIPKPLRRGRVAIYTERHLAKLRAINKLLGNGFTLSHSATFLTDPRARIGEALDLSEVLGEQWSKGHGTQVTRADLEAMLGPLDEATLAALVDADIVRPTGRAGVYATADDAIVANLGRLVDRGMPLARLIEVHAEFADRLGGAVRVLMQAAHEEIIRRRGAGWEPTSKKDVAWVTDLLVTMRTVGTENAYNALDRALDAGRVDQLKVHEEAVADARTARPGAAEANPAGSR
ncbi:MerR family transcriptional regulator [Gordonia shandongensis]|uniref:MerR family transcriptional regulator n=1 Tax=Gordonia shandongensis TaxID=376351 RepID=UPI000412AE39|nr:MerR family transcriptional regulator [Gordonia shandongensis]